MTIYIDSDYKCHASNDGAMRKFDVPFFDYMCVPMIESHKFVPSGENWVDEDGNAHAGETVFPWRNTDAYVEDQAKYEQQLLEQLKAENSIMKEALAELGVTEDD